MSDSSCGTPQESEFGRLPRLARPTNYQIRSLASLSARCPTAPVGPALQLEQRLAQTVGLALVRITFALRMRGWCTWVECESERFEPVDASTQSEDGAIGVNDRLRRAHPRSHYARPRQTWHFFKSRCTAE